MRYRYAVYFVPEPDSALARLGSGFLGRDSETGETIEHAPIEGFSRQRLYVLTTEARRYGLHATLKAPFFLKEGLEEDHVLETARRFVSGRSPIVLPRLKLAQIGSFFALTPANETPEEQVALQQINALAADAVSFFDPLRASPASEEITRRNPQKLTERQRALLEQWGYPYVFAEYRFHLTVTDKLHSAEEAAAMRYALEHFFSPLFHEPASLGGICICRQENDRIPGIGGSFSLMRRFRF